MGKKKGWKQVASSDTKIPAPNGNDNLPVTQAVN